ncbi:hypothetical protein [Phenylobacterium aquaticum]|uniref:hypothetical protein n=3 Tax=Phenylobacterium aquaticum TaxID=1763816 RepID=UPI0026EA4E2F|nr:hypothetical protein [Phenylobacterium aquaticum]
MTLALDRADAGQAFGRLRGATDWMLAAQTPDGAIPWFEDGPWDAWNHAECVMALAVMGEAEAASRGLEYLARTQARDGSWHGEYGNVLPMADRLTLARTKAPAFKDSNFIAYPAVAVWRQYRLDGDIRTARRYWPMVRAAIDFVLTLQHPEGDISWSAEAHGTSEDDCVLAGAASIFKSLSCALLLAEAVQDPKPLWREAQARLKRAILCKPERFDRQQDRSHFAMDWYYPILCGVMPLVPALARLESRAQRFIEPGHGCRCVSDQPWATVAESCELALTAISLGARNKAQTLLDWQMNCRDEDGVFWMGWQFEENIVWPAERPTWTQAAAILATDALHRATPGWDVLVKG